MTSEHGETLEGPSKIYFFIVFSFGFLNKLIFGVQSAYIRFILLQERCRGLFDYKEVSRSIVLEIAKARKILESISITTTSSYEKDSPPTIKIYGSAFSAANNKKKILC